MSRAFTSFTIDSDDRRTLVSRIKVQGESERVSESTMSFGGTSDRRVANTFSYALAGRMPSSDPSQLAKSLEKLLIKFMGNAILINERNVEDLAG